MKRALLLVILVTAVTFAGCSRETPPEQGAGEMSADAAAARAGAIRSATATVATERIQAANAEPGNWLAHGRTYDE